MPSSARERLDSLVDEDSFERDTDELHSGDPLGFPGYKDALEQAKHRSGSDESVVTGAASIGGIRVRVACFEFGFIAGSMGEVAGERIARGLERASEEGVPFVLCTATGGARMQEGMRALIQMPKLASARHSLANAHQPMIAIFDDPTTGGVLASIAALADITLAIEGATIGFAGPRLVETHTGNPLRAGSHSAGSAFEHGLVDQLVSDEALRQTVTHALTCSRSPRRDGEYVHAHLSVQLGEGGDAPAPEDPSVVWRTVEAVRAPERVTAPELVEGVGQPFELRGDRAGGDDPAVRVFLTNVRDYLPPVLILALDRRHHPGPRAYRKARRSIEIAGRLNVPIATLIDTSGADPSEDSEAGGIAWAIAELLDALLTAPVPTVAIATGEGGSGGALAFAATDVLVATMDSIFSVIAPEAAANILWRDPSRAPEAAGLLKLTATDLKRLGIADYVVPPVTSNDALQHTLAYHLVRLLKEDRSPESRVEKRLERWRHRGQV